MKFLRDVVALFVAVVLVWSSMLTSAMAAQTALYDIPIGVSGSSNVPANVLFVPSVEFPTAVSQAHIGNFDRSQTYLGYFDPYKCYDYKTTGSETYTQGSPATTVTLPGYFFPVGWTDGVTAANGLPVFTGNRTCMASSVSNKWSGNFLNWATMQTIDTFRLVLTGGDRLVDMTAQTIVQKAVASGQGGESNFATKTINSPDVADVTPCSTASLSVRIQGLSRAMRIGPSTSVSSANAVTNGTLCTQVVDRNVAVAVCVPTLDPVLNLTMLESNCTAYGGNFKPEGLIQKNASRMRFGMFSYLNDSDINRDGGVMRSRLKAVGPTMSVPGTVPAANAAKEWNESTGIFYTNPDPTDATASGVTNSGVVNYLNKFGLSGSYKTYDNVSELYYTALRYLRHLGPVTEYQNNLNSTMIDGFPVITTWDDPIQYVCQKNFTVGIGDVNTWRDRNLPGGTNRSNEPTIESAVTSDAAFDVNALANTIGSLEGLGAIGGNFIGAGQASYYIASMAYWAHINDIRPDIGVSTDPPQTVSFFWVDVMENRVYSPKNQYWLAAKYGGFIDSDGSKTPNINTEWMLNQQTFAQSGTNYPLPDNYFPGSNPAAMAYGLSQTFAQINSLVSRQAGVGLSSANITGTGAGGYTPSFSAIDWTGDLIGSAIISDTAGNVVASTGTTFSAQAQLEILAAGTGWANNRKIVTGNYNGTVFSVIPFNQTSLSTAQLAALDPTPATAKKIVDFLRGDRSNEGGTFRVRPKLLGTIVASNPETVGPSVQPYDDGANPGYTAFKTDNLDRSPVVLLGANDGMLHAFDGTFTSSGGKELWAYVPYSLYTTDPNFATNGLANYASKGFAVRNLVNGPVASWDVDFSNTGDGSNTLTGNGSGWHTIAVAGMGKGGKSYFAIDVTDPTAMTTESAVASKVLWEFTDPRMGYSFGTPRFFKTARYGWVVAVSSGYNNADGKGYIFLLDPKTGVLRETLQANEGTASSPIGVAEFGAYIPDKGDYTADSIYAGDLVGNLWRWDMTSGTGAGGAPSGGVRQAVKIANVGQSITVAPQIQSVSGSQDRYVFFGTGRYRADSDLIQTATQSLYGIRDGSRLAFSTTTTAPNPFPVGRSQLQQVTDLTAGVTASSTKSGWFYDLGSANERIVVNPTALNGTVVFASLLPTADPCAPAGTSNVYVLGYANGKSQLSVPYVSLSQSAVSTTIVGTGSSLTIVVTESGNNTSDVTKTGVKCVLGSAYCSITMKYLSTNSVHRLNVREIRPGL